jgi:hypothetical protein
MIVSVPYTPTGPDFACSRRRSPSIGRGSTSPTRPCTTRPAQRCRPSTAHRVLKLADAAYDLTIVEDDIFADFEPDAGAPARRFDGWSG